MDFTLVLNQLTNSNNGKEILKRFIGAYSFIKCEEEYYIRFKFKGCKYADFCKIRLNNMDLYDMEINLINHNPKNTGDLFIKTKKFKSLFFDDLKAAFENYTKLYLSLK